MVFSLQKRFFLFLLLPVTLILAVTGIASFLYARSYLLDEWSSSAKMSLEKMAHELQTRLDQKRQMIDLIVNAENIPDAVVTRSYLAQQLADQEGVGFVDIQEISGKGPGKESTESFHYESRRSDINPMAQMMRRMGRGHMMQRSAPGAIAYPGGMMMRHRGHAVWLDQTGNFLSIVKEFRGARNGVRKKIIVRVSFQSFMKNILDVGNGEGSYACLVNSDGTYLAHTNPTMSSWKKLGETDDPLEEDVLKEMKDKHFGAVFGEGHPPDWIVGFYKVPTTDWYLILSSKGSVVLAPIVRFRFNYLLAGLASLICVGLLIRWNTLPVAKSVAEISQAAAKVEDGDYTVSIPDDRTDEIGYLKRRFNKMIDGLKQRDLIERTFGRYVDKNIAQDLMSRPEALHLGGEKQTVTVMMADLRGFTQSAEKLDPEVVIAMLNRYFARMIGVIENYQGIIVDFFGDSVLVFFNGFHSGIPERAADAIRCAVEMQRRLAVVSEENQQRGLPPLEMGIGIHTGEVVVGNIGSETRAKYGIVGSAVNETDRIQSTAQGGAVMISEQTYSVVADRVEVGPKWQASLKGLEGLRDLYEVKAIDDERLPG
jgi:adenylate cyclase